MFQRLRTFLTIVLAATALAATSSCASVGSADAPEQAPNVIIFYVDDVGWKDFGAYGNNFYETPNIDRLASEGMRFTQFYAYTVCSPSRAMLMTGLYNTRYHKYRAGTNGVDEPYVPEEAGSNREMVYPEGRGTLPLGIRTVAESFKDAGYNAWHLGKWHLGDGEYDSDQRGFDYRLPKGFDGPGGKTGGYFAPWLDSINEQFDGLEDGDYITERLTQRAVELIEGSSDSPFFLYLAHYNAHAPYQAKSTDVDYFQRKLEEADDPSAFTHNNPVYAAMVKTMDESLGALLRTLDEQGIEDETIVILASDNGARPATDDMGEFLAPDFTEFRDLGRHQVTSNDPLRAGKGDIYEGGIRVPMIVRYPGTVPAGTTEDEVVHTIDIYPTLLDLTPARETLGQLFDGVSIAPLLTQSGGLSREYTYGYYPKQGQGAWIRGGDYKLMEFHGEGPNRTNRYELYDLSSDVGETNDLSADLPEVTSRLRARLHAWLQETGALLPIPNPAYDASASDESDSKNRRRQRKQKG